MKNPDLKFNKPFKANDMLSEISLQYKLDKADPISQNIAGAEIVAHTYEVKKKALRELLDEGKFSSQVASRVEHLINLVDKKLDAYKERKSLIKLKHEPTQVYALAKEKDQEDFIDKLEEKISLLDDEIQYTYDHLERVFPEAFEIIQEKFNSMQTENRTN